jgi:CelD/BcsL family acetyltransferase involved in cellulose biosynthesis
MSGRLRHSKKFFKTILYKERKLVKDHGELRFDFGSSDARALRHLMNWKSAQYRRTSRGDRFAKRWVRETVEELFATQSPSLRGALSTLHVEDRLIAADFSLRSPFVLACWFPSHDMEMAKYSPGSIRTLAMVRAAAAEGLVHMDLGKGEEEYKQNLKTADTCVAEGRADDASPIAVVRRASGAPGRIATHFVLSRPRVRLAARATLRRLGELRS